ncbi:MAG: NVEALA domain-containing protein [Candidatus Symbiothrix sp.]|jgi:hypothetical protein|nr:NVEALA domain-containing protein [Candidatus Symbiothrix sp.]
MTIKKIICGIAVLAIAAVAAVNVTKSNTRTTALTDLQLANVEALASDEHPSGGSSEVDCFSVTNNCWFWNCSTVYRCTVTEPCYTVSCDAYSYPGKCYP